MLIATGRKAFTDKAGLAEAGVALDERGRVKVDAHLQTNVPGIYAIGDVIAGPMLAHKAEDEGVAVAEIIAGQAGHVNYDVIPSVVYTSPEIASVGKTEEELKKRRASPTRSANSRSPPMARARAMLHTEGFVKILADQKTDRVLGMHIVGFGAGELIHEARGADGIRRFVGGSGAHLPCASDHVGSRQGSGAGDLLQADPHLTAVASDEYEKTARSRSGPPFCVLAEYYCAGAGAGAGWRRLGRCRRRFGRRCVLRSGSCLVGGRRREPSHPEQPERSHRERQAHRVGRRRGRSSPGASAGGATVSAGARSEDIERDRRQDHDHGADQQAIAASAAHTGDCPR